MTRLVLFLLFAALPAQAQLTYPGGRAITCYCTDSIGARVEMGDEACLSIGSRNFMARCAMSLNVPIWRDTGHGCPMS